MKPFILIDKPQGMTPLSAIELFRERTPEYKIETLGVAGRLDPMADGLLLVLVGEENKKRKEYEKFPKTYSMEMLFGFETDSYDELGIVTNTSDPTAVIKKNVEDAVAKIPQSFDQPYPPYSSKPVNGKPLYYWAREGKIDSISIPKKLVELYHRSVDNWHSVSKTDLHNHTQSRIQHVTGNFRQKEILESWKSQIADSTIQSFPVAGVTVSCSSGTYMRGLANMIGEMIGIPAIAYSIRRTHIGQYSLVDAVQVL